MPATLELRKRGGSGSNLPPSGGRWVVAILGARLLQIFLAPPPAFAQPELNFVKLEGIFEALFNGLFALLGITTLIGIVMGAYQYMMSEGDSKQLEAAKKTLSWAIVGAIIGAACYLIVNVVWAQIFQSAEPIKIVIPG